MITVIVPIYNVEKYLEKCIDSIINQTYKDIEILLINDCSKDNSLEICKEMKKKDERISIINLPNNHGVSYARNIGIENSNGEYIAFVDSDDYIDSKMLEILMRNLIESKSDISICGFNNNNYSKIINSKKVLDKKQMLLEITGKDSFQGYVCNKLYRKSIIKKYKIMFDENITISEDLLFNCEYISKIEKGIYDSQKLYNYIQRSDSSYNGEFNIKWFTVLDAYKKILDIYAYNHLEDYIGIKYNFLVANLTLKEKIVNGEYKNIKIKNIENNINRYLKDILNSNYINNVEKIKIIIKSKFMKLFICLKKCKKNNNSRKK